MLKRCCSAGKWFDLVIDDITQSPVTASQHNNTISYVSQYIPLWVGIADLGSPQAEAVTQSFLGSGLIQPGGIATSTFNSTQQWDFPNCWAPLQASDLSLTFSVLCLSVCVSVCCGCLCLSVCASVCCGCLCLSVCVSVCCGCLCLSVRVTACLCAGSVCVLWPVCCAVAASVRLYVCLWLCSVCLYVCLAVWCLSLSVCICVCHCAGVLSAWCAASMSHT